MFIRSLFLSIIFIIFTNFIYSQDIYKRYNNAINYLKENKELRKEINKTYKQFSCKKLKFKVEYAEIGLGSFDEVLDYKNNKNIKFEPNISLGKFKELSPDKKAKFTLYISGIYKNFILADYLWSGRNASEDEPKHRWGTHFQILFVFDENNKISNTYTSNIIVN